MQSLSKDVLHEIFKYLPTDDLLNVSLLCRAFNEACNPLVYAVLYLTWTDISEIAESEDTDHRIQYAKQAHIAADGRGEWVFSAKLPALIEASNFRLRGLNITCALHSSGWLKYIEMPLSTIRQLKLTTSGSFSNYSFDFAHIAMTMPAVEVIELGDSLGGFFIDPFPDGGLENLHTIKVENCEWHYPSLLTDAAQNSVLETLEIRLTQPMHPFIYSERLIAECINLPRSLKRLAILLDVRNPLNWNPLQRAKALAHLERAEFEGFSFKYHPRLKSDLKEKFPKLKDLVER